MYLDTITLFVRNTVDGELFWRPVVIGNGYADFNADRSLILATYGENSQDTAKLHLRYDVGEIVDGWQYVLPKEWNGAKGTFTIQSGNDFSFFWVGEYEVAEDIADSEFRDGFYNFFNKTHDEVYAVTSVAKYSVIPHFEVMAR